MKKARKYSFLLCTVALIASLVGCSPIDFVTNASAKEKNNKTEKQELDSHESAQIMDDEKELIAQEEQQKQDNEIIDWNAPSNGSYPTLDKSKSIWIDVSVNDQKVYIKDGDATLYTMTASTGIDTNDDNSTPKGIYYIEPERGEWFFSSGYGEGAEYWVSWKNHGEFLFHSVPMNGNKQVIEEEAKKLGEKASHGCIRLTIADAKWIYEHIQTNTKVVIRS